jgi:hypothetical protein
VAIGASGGDKMVTVLDVPHAMDRMMAWIVWLAGIPEEQELGMWLLLRISPDEITTHNALFHIPDGSSAQSHLFCLIF